MEIEIKRVMKYEVEGEFFDSEESAKVYAKELEFKNKLIIIIADFYYRGIEADDIVDGIIRNKGTFLKILSQEK